MRLVNQQTYREYTVLCFEARAHELGKPPERHWLVIDPDGVSVIGAPKMSEEEARKFVDSQLGRTPD